MAVKIQCSSGPGLPAEARARLQTCAFLRVIPRSAPCGRTSSARHAARDSTLAYPACRDGDLAEVSRPIARSVKVSECATLTHFGRSVTLQGLRIASKPVKSAACFRRIFRHHRRSGACRGLPRVTARRCAGRVRLRTPPVIAVWTIGQVPQVPFASTRSTPRAARCARCCGAAASFSLLPRPRPAYTATDTYGPAAPHPPNPVSQGRMSPQCDTENAPPKEPLRPALESGVFGAACTR